MGLLAIVTWTYAGVLVLALAASLTAVWIRLLMIARVLGEVREALSTVATETEPLESNLKQIEAAVAGAASLLGADRERAAQGRALVHSH